MSFKKIKLCHIRSIPIYIDYSWFLIFGLFVFTLTKHFAFSLKLESLSFLPLSMGIITVILAFTCFLIHELSHSFVAIKNGIPIKHITLYMLGLGAALSKDMENAGQEFKIAIAGPIANFIIAGLLIWPTLILFQGLPAYYPIWLILDYLVMINIIVGLFNLAPAFPLDGGRILRSALWFIFKNKIKATRGAVWVGKFMAGLMFLIALHYGMIIMLLISVYIFFMGNAELARLEQKK